MTCPIRIYYSTFATTKLYSAQISTLTGTATIATTPVVELKKLMIAPIIENAIGPCLERSDT